MTTNVRLPDVFYVKKKYKWLFLFFAKPHKQIKGEFIFKNLPKSPMFEGRCCDYSGTPINPDDKVFCTMVIKYRKTCNLLKLLPLIGL